jgi:hypothetical protein
MNRSRQEPAAINDNPASACGAASGDCIGYCRRTVSACFGPVVADVENSLRDFRRPNGSADLGSPLPVGIGQGPSSAARKAVQGTGEAGCDEHPDDGSAVDSVR